jgi:anti-anti-sigma factor
VDHQALSIEVVPDGRAVTFVLNGEVDRRSVGVLRACLDHLDSHWRTVVLEMGGVTLIDSSGVALLLQAHRAFGVDFRKLELRQVPAHVLRVLELSGAAEFVPLVGTVPAGAVDEPMQPDLDGMVA